MKGLFLAFLAVVACEGYGIEAKVQARDDMMQAKQAYTQCLQGSSGEVARCEGYKQAYQADLQT